MGTKYKFRFIGQLYLSLVPRTELIGDSDRYVKAGSAVILRCVVRGALEPPSYIIWYHGTQQIFTESRRGWKTQLDRGAPDLDGDIHSTPEC
uniref:Ig-like domain-containing protein n=1 Tax=Anopheles christyi TaxID=43041 RepID=A0A182K508_9DIPT